jgi:hypothetical protein
LALQAHILIMKEEGFAPPSTAPSWTKIDAYLRPMRRPKARPALPPRTQPETTKALLTTLPFAALLFGFMIMSISIALAAWPPSQPQAVAPVPATREPGFAPKGWLEEAKRDFHH